MGPWYDVAVHMHRDDLHVVNTRRPFSEPSVRAWPTGLAALGLAVLILAV